MGTNDGVDFSLIRHTPIHHEADIFYSKDSEGKEIVTKRYRLDSSCIEWLNDHLARFYDPVNGLPVAQHEFRGLGLLANYGIAPKPIQLMSDAVVMRYEGLPVRMIQRIPGPAYFYQCLRILLVLRKLRFRHNDLKADNVVIQDGSVKVIDFTLSEFDGIEIMPFLPEDRWARSGRDGDLLLYFPGYFWPGMSRFLYLLGRLLTDNTVRYARLEAS